MACVMCSSLLRDQEKLVEKHEGNFLLHFSFCGSAFQSLIRLSTFPISRRASTEPVLIPDSGQTKPQAVENYVRQHEISQDSRYNYIERFKFLTFDAWPIVEKSSTENPDPELRSQNCASWIR